MVCERRIVNTPSKKKNLTPILHYCKQYSG